MKRLELLEDCGTDAESRRQALATGQYGVLCAIEAWEPTLVLARHGNELLQLWTERFGGRKEWRALPTMEEAQQLYGPARVVGR